MKRRIYLIFLMLFSATPLLQAEESAGKRHSVEASWMLSLPVEKNGFMSSPNWIAPMVGYHYRINPLWSVGVSSGYAYGTETGMTHDRFDGDQIDGNTTRSLTMVPLQAEVRLFPWANHRLAFQPYLGVAAGTNYTRFDISGDVINKTTVSNWGELVTANLGARYSFCSGKTYIDGALLWRYAGNEFKIMDTNYMQSVGVRLGVGFLF